MQTKKIERKKNLFSNKRWTRKIAHFVINKTNQLKQIV